MDNKIIGLLLFALIISIVAIGGHIDEEKTSTNLEKEEKNLDVFEIEKLTFKYPERYKEYDKVPTNDDPTIYRIYD